MASTTGKRIKDRRRDLGIGVQELADMLGKNRTTVYRYESDAVEDMPYVVLQNLAEVLRTTPAYLMGLTNDPTDYSDPELLTGLPLAMHQEWQDEGLSDEEMGRRYAAFRKAQEQDWIAAKEKSPSSSEDGPSAEAQEAAMLFDSAPEWLRQQVLGLLRAAESNRAARDDDPKDT